MRRLVWVLAAGVLAGSEGLGAQDALTSSQRAADLNQLAGLYAKNYAPYEWKRDVFGFDLLNLGPWYRRSERADDLDFQEVLIDYVASLNDAHDIIAFPTTYSVSLGLSLDIYDGRVLIDAISRAALPLDRYPFAVGDEVIAIDGQPVRQVLQAFRKYAVAANPRSTARTAAGRLVSRSQQIMPHIPALEDVARLTVRQAGTRTDRVYEIAWSRFGIPVTSQGPVPSPRRWQAYQTTEGAAEGAAPAIQAPARPGSLFALEDTRVDAGWLPAYMRPMAPLLNAAVPGDYYGVIGLGSRFPVYGRPAGFVQRLGNAATDNFLTGTFVASGVRVGLLRIPTMAPANPALALQQLDAEIAFFNANTDALIVDVMRNTGGLLSYAEAVAQRLMTGPFNTVGFEVRATAALLFTFAAQLTTAELTNAPPEVVENLRSNYNEVLRAYNEKRGRSAPISLNATGSLVIPPVQGAYAKPLMLMTDEFSASAAEMLAAMIQDNQRGQIFGMRTMGAGGSVVGFTATSYTESIARVTLTLMNRGRTIRTREYPESPYIENVGVRPDIMADYMTRANLMTGGAPFIEAFTAAIVRIAGGGVQ